MPILSRTTVGIHVPADSGFTIVEVIVASVMLLMIVSGVTLATISASSTSTTVTANVSAEAAAERLFARVDATPTWTDGCTSGKTSAASCDLVRNVRIFPNAETDVATLMNEDGLGFTWSATFVAEPVDQPADGTGATDIDGPLDQWRITATIDLPNDEARARFPNFAPITLTRLSDPAGQFTPPREPNTLTINACRVIDQIDDRIDASNIDGCVETRMADCDLPPGFRWGSCNVTMIPSPGVRIRLSRAGQSYDPTSTSNGTWMWSDLASGTYQLEITPPDRGFERWKAMSFLGDAVTINARSGTALNVIDKPVPRGQLKISGSSLASVISYDYQIKETQSKRCIKPDCDAQAWLVYVRQKDWKSRESHQISKLATPATISIAPYPVGRVRAQPSLATIVNRGKGSSLPAGADLESGLWSLTSIQSDSETEAESPWSAYVGSQFWVNPTGQVNPSAKLDVIQTSPRCLLQTSSHRGSRWQRYERYLKDALPGKHGGKAELSLQLEKYVEACGPPQADDVDAPELREVTVPTEFGNPFDTGNPVRFIVLFGKIYQYSDADGRRRYTLGACVKDGKHTDCDFRRKPVICREKQERTNCEGENFTIGKYKIPNDFQNFG